MERRLSLEEAVIRTVKRHSDFVDGVTPEFFGCQLCDYAEPDCRRCPCVQVFGAHCNGINLPSHPLDEHYPRTHEEKLLAACMIAAVLGIEVE
jgi:hypothetical protein